MPRILTPREMDNVENFIASKMEYWNIALGITDIMRRNPRYAERTRMKMEDKGHVFSLANQVKKFEEEPWCRDWLVHILLDPNPRFWKYRFTNASAATALSQGLTIDKLLKGTNRWPDHVVLFGLKEIGRTLSELRAERDIPAPFELDSSVAMYLHNIDPLQPLAYEENVFNVMGISDAMVIELMDNPEGIENVIFMENSLPYCIVDWGVDDGEHWWERRCANMDSFVLDDQSMEELLRNSAFVLQ